MRFTEFKLFEAENRKVFVFGDSIAAAIKAAAKAAGSAKGGENTDQVLARIEDFIASQGDSLVGATVILSSGASNSTYERKTGEKKNLNTAPIAKQISSLKAAGATNVILVGTGSGESKWITNKFGQYRVNFKDQQVNEKLAGVAASAGAKFLGPLESFDPSINSSGDGIHPSSDGYSKIYQAALNISPAKVSQAPQAAPGGQLTVPSNKWHGADTAAIQSALISLGYKLPKHGADGFFGPETARAVKQFQKDNSLKIDGDPGPETIGKLNSLVKPADKIKTAPSAASAPTEKSAQVAPSTRGPKNLGKPQQGAMVAPSRSAAPSGKAGANMVSKSEVSNYLKSKGMSGNHRIGILANIQGESGFNSANINPNDKGMRAIGLFQHRGDRDQKLEAAVPNWRTNWKGQIDFALAEPAGKRYLATKFKTYEQAVEQWVRDFERPQDAWGDTMKRITYADQMAKSLG